MTVLILAGERDVSADLMVRALGDRGVPVLRADLGWFPQQLTFEAPSCGTAGGLAGWQPRTARWRWRSCGRSGTAAR